MGSASAKVILALLGALATTICLASAKVGDLPPDHLGHMKLTVAVLAGTLLSGCTSYYRFTPQLVTYYDEDCKVNARQIVLNIEQLGAFRFWR